MGLWQAVKSMSNHAIMACIKSFLWQRSRKGTVKASSGAVIVFRSIEKTGQGSVTNAFISTVSTNGSVSALSFIGEKSKP